MAPVYFPFTFMNQTAADMLRICFPKTVMYLPSAADLPEIMKKQIGKEFMELRTPAAEDQEKLLSVVNEYRNWAQLHQGQNLSFFRTGEGKLPFFDEFSVHEIMSDIRRKKEGNIRPDQTPDPLFQARIFLSISQEYDMRQWELSSHLESVSEMEASLLREIRGDEEEDADTGPSISSMISKDDPGAHMTAERLNAWARLALCDPDIPNLFITGSRAVMETVCDRIPEARKVLDVNGISLAPEAVKQWQEALAECLERISHAETVSETETITAAENADEASAFPMTFYRISGTSPRAFLNRFIHPESSVCTEKENVLIGWVG
ncbi:MAG: hypothetical protein AB7S75_25075 [Desulfococcaceae bacterium]